MFAANSRSDVLTAEPFVREAGGEVLAALQRLRVAGGVSVEFAARGGVTGVARSHEVQGWRIRIPHPASCDCEAVLLNTGGGVAGGDAVKLEFKLCDNARATVTTVAGERIYRAVAQAARMEAQLTLSGGSHLVWLPREMIMSSGARLVRRVNVEMAENAALTLLDIVVLGRRGSGEHMTSGLLDDRWSIRRAGRLHHMEAMKLDGNIEQRLARPATAGGAHVIGTLIHLDRDAEACLDRVRQAVSGHDGVEVAASAWAGKLVVRGLGTNVERVRSVFAAAVSALTGRPMPRAWLT
ncbi:MAG: urease accessory protein UreD [Hyphomicrobiaceae bacterium]